MMLPCRDKTHYGFHDGNCAAVFVSNASHRMTPLPLRCDIVNHTPTGFGWGYSGSGPAQLAVAILADHFDCAFAARALHQRSKSPAIAGFSERHWCLTGTDLAPIFERMCRNWLRYGHEQDMRWNEYLRFTSDELSRSSLRPVPLLNAVRRNCAPRNSAAPVASSPQ